MIDEKQLYRSSVAEGLVVPVFSNPWWLDSTIGSDGWDVVLVFRDNKIKASWPYTIRQRLGVRFLSQPPLTPYLGPWLQANENDVQLKFSHYQNILKELLDKMPAYAEFSQSLHPAHENWLPFYWNGFSQTTGYTYQIDLNIPPEKILNNATSTLKRKLKKCQERLSLSVTFGNSAADFLDLFCEVYQRQGLTTPVSENFLRSLIDRIYEKDSGTVAVCRNSDGDRLAAALLVKSGSTIYYLAGGSTLLGRKNNAVSFCLWESIKYSILHAERFDFEGSMVEPIESSFRSFGGKRIAYNRISRTPSKILKVIRALQ